MFKTGNISIDSFSQLVALLPLCPALIIFIRAVYKKEILNFLMILCILNLLDGLILLFETYPDKNRDALHLLFSYLELIAFIQIFKTSLSVHSKYIVWLVTLLYFSIVATYYFSSPSFQYGAAINIAFNTLIVIVSVVSLSNAIKIYDLQIFSNPIFWIATGTLFYMLVSILTEINLVCCAKEPGSSLADSMALLDVANLVRYFFYSIAAAYYFPRPEKNIV